ncbi:hypothetical protein KXD40_004199 [Peronospora effusa]|nr:hypothetical protein KXD40_004199 [Peronospora effusa]
MHLSNVLLCSVAAVFGIAASNPSKPQPILIAGTYTRDMGWINGTGEGIYTYKIMDDGSLIKLAVTVLGSNPMYVQGTNKKFNTGKKVIYAVNSIDDVVPKEPGKVTGYVSALSLNGDGTLKLLNTLPTRGGSPTHISLNSAETFVVVSNYAGSVTMFPIHPDGSLGKETYHEEFLKGSKVVKERQDTGHIHSSTWLLNSDHVILANLGSDELIEYKLKPKKQTLKRIEAVKNSHGAGPRHMALHPKGKIAYVVNELSNTVSVYKINDHNEAPKMSKKALQEITTLPSTFTGFSTSADIHLSSNGKFLYTSNRGHDSIAIFKIEIDGTLVSIGWEKTRGTGPRGFVITGNYLIVANQNSNDMFVFKLDCETGLLSFTGNKYEIGTAVCLYVTDMRLASVSICLVAVVAIAAAATRQSTTQSILFVATSTKETTNGINTFKLNTADGSLVPYGITPLAFAEKGLNPTYVQGSTKKFSKGERVIYALNRGSTTGHVSAMTLQSDGTLKVLNSQQMKGGSPAHLALSPREDFVSVANYVGSLSLFPLNADGSVGAQTFYQNFPVGSKVVMDQQAIGHIHSTAWLFNSSKIIAADLGGDELLLYKLDKTKKTLDSLKTVKSSPGSGPRHMAIHPNGGFVYVTNELSNTVSVYTINDDAEFLSSPALQEITTLPPGFTNTNSAADIHFSSNGKFVYVSNRGDNSIVAYKVNADGTLKALRWTKSRGVTPRSFIIYKDWLIVGNEGSNDMYVFKVDGATGALEYTGNSYAIDGPVSFYVAEY